VHCLRVFRSSAPSELLPSSPGGRPSGVALSEFGSTRSMEWGVGLGGEVSQQGLSGRDIARRVILGGTLSGPVRSQGRAARCVIQNWPHVLSAPRRASPGSSTGMNAHSAIPPVPPQQAQLRQAPPARTSRQLTRYVAAQLPRRQST
jgi:hypothetical protein